MSLVWTEHHRCQHCTAGSGQHYEHCPKFKPDPNDLYRLTQACPTCSIPDSRPCSRCHHPRGLHDETACAFFLACQCERYEPIECQYGCRDGRLVPAVIKEIVQWYVRQWAGGIWLSDDLDELVFALDERASVEYPLFPNAKAHHEHIHVEMKLGDLNESETENGV